jgi:hypothetical protein
VRHLEGKRKLRRLRRNGMIILICVLKKWNGGLGWIFLVGVGTGGRLL